MARPENAAAVADAWLRAATNPRTVVRALESWARINGEIGRTATPTGLERPTILFVSSWDPLHLRRAAHRALPPLDDTSAFSPVDPGR